MGQRLVITIHAFNEDIAKIYYHWSAYTVNALNEAKSIIENIDWSNSTTKNELILKLIRFLEENGGGIDGGIDSKEYNYVNQYFGSKYKFVKNPDRTNGLISISESGMNEMESYSEGDLEIDFDEQIIHNDVFSFVGSKEELASFYYDIYDEKIELSEINNLCTNLFYDPQTIYFFDLDITLSQLQDCPSMCMCDTTYYMFID